MVSDSTQKMDRYARQQAIVPAERLAEVDATVVGVGALGRSVALQLAAIGVPKMQLIDHDNVEPVNLATQGYNENDLGRAKVHATAEACHALNSGIDLTTHERRFRRSDHVGNVLVCCVDSIDTRRFIWNAVRDRVGFFADGRMTAEVLRVLIVNDAAARAYYPTTLFAADRAFRGACTARSTIFTATIAAGLIVSQLTRWLRGLPTDGDLMLNLLASELEVECNPEPNHHSDE